MLDSDLLWLEPLNATSLYKHGIVCPVETQVYTEGGD